MTDNLKHYITMKGVAVVSCSLFVLVLLIPALAQKGGGSTSSCATVDVPRLSTSTSSPGSNIGVFGKVTNCSSGKKRFTVTAKATSSCGEETIIASSVVSFNSGESKGISVAYPIEPDVCKGVSTISISAYDGSELLSSQSTQLTIQ